MAQTLADSLRGNFLGNSPIWYKWTIIAFLIINPILVVSGYKFIAGWVLVLQFIFTLAMALKCYPLQPGGLLAIQALLLGLTTPGHVFHEAENNFPVIMLLMFMVAGIYFLREMLLFTFTKILLGVRSKVLLSLIFSFTAAVLSAFLDALTVTAVIITVAVGFYGVYHKVASGKHFHHDDHDASSDEQVIELHREDLEQFRAFLRSLMMHGAVGTALGGVTTLVGEPQNLLIAEKMDWEFVEFFMKMAHISMPVLVVGLMTCAALEVVGYAGYGTKLNDKVRTVLEDFDKETSEKRTQSDRAVIIVQAIVAVLLVIALGTHAAEPGIVGLMVIVLATAFNGVTEEHRIGHAFEEALPFTALLVVFFAIVAVIADQGLFDPVINFVMTYDGKTQAALFYVANGVLSMISDNVFVATVYINEVAEIYAEGGLTREQFDALAIAINTGTNIPSVATPNGQAAFLFLLTSALAPLIRLSYGRMVIMALPYTFTMSITGLAALWYLG
ncbi:MAG: sodium/proton antiporter NhaB [Woeseiaceae bacterium]|nr:sodium/proton antiporter NhaB [Woeseiaceae bacterium]